MQNQRQIHHYEVSMHAQAIVRFKRECVVSVCDLSTILVEIHNHTHTHTSHIFQVYLHICQKLFTEISVNLWLDLKLIKPQCINIPLNNLCMMMLFTRELHLYIAFMNVLIGHTYWNWNAWKFRRKATELWFLFYHRFNSA